MGFTENTDNTDNVVNTDNTVDLVASEEEKSSKEDKSRNWLEKWAEGKFTPADNEELWGRNPQEIRQGEANYTLSDEFEKEFNCSGTNPENSLPGSCMALILNSDNVPRGWRQAINTPERDFE